MGLTGEANFLTAGVGMEIVYDLYTFEVGMFKNGSLGVGITAAGFDLTGSVGVVTGWSNFRKTPTITNYSGYVLSGGFGGTLAEFVSAGFAISLSADEQRRLNGNMTGVAVQGSVGAGLNPFLIFNLGFTPLNTTVLVPGSQRVFRTGQQPTKDDAMRYALFLHAHIPDEKTRLFAIAVVLYNGLVWQHKP